MTLPSLLAAILLASSTPTPAPTPDRAPRPITRETSPQAAATTKSAGAPASTTSADASSGTVHVRVSRPGSPDEDVSVDVPFALARALVTMAGQQAIDSGKIEYSGTDLSLTDLRTAWGALKLSKGEPVTVRKNDQTLSFSLRKDVLALAVTGRAGAEDVHVEVPAKAIDALLSGQGNTMNVAGCLDALERVRGTDVIRVSDGESRIRIWID